MTAKNRAGLIAKLHTSLKKHYKPAPAAPGRPLLEHILYAALLEDAPVDLADEGFAKCEQEFFDWNEVRVTSVTELAEVLSRFPSPPTTAARLKQCLQSVFEGFYNFDIDHLKKENLGKAVAKFEAMSGISPFVLAYLVQHGLGGHAIPVNSAAMHIMLKMGIVSESEARSGKVPGLERAIPKSKAIEFSSMLHQAAVALQADPLDKTVWEMILSVNEDAKVSPPRKARKQRPATRIATQADPASSEKSASKASGKAEPKSKSKTTAKPTAAAADPAAAKTPAKSAKASKPATGKTGTDDGSADSGRSKSGSAATGVSKTASPSRTPAAKSSAGGAAAKKAASKTPKKPDTGKTASSSKPAAGKGPSKTNDVSSPSVSGSPSGEPKKAEDASAAGGTGNQKLSKQKPR